MLLLPLCARDAVKAGVRGQISALIGQSGIGQSGIGQSGISQFRHDPAGRQAGKFRRITEVWNGGAFVVAELVRRLWPLNQGTPVGVNLIAPGA